VVVCEGPACLPRILSKMLPRMDMEAHFVG
jgi:hypothetical protein